MFAVSFSARTGDGELRIEQTQAGPASDGPLECLGGRGMRQAGSDLSLLLTPLVCILTDRTGPAPNPEAPLAVSLVPYVA
jgi:hypothetical protein